MNKYVFNKYNDNYKKYFSKEKKNVKRVLGNRVFIEHVGSTAIPKLGGKGIVDIVVGIEDNHISEYCNILKKSGYEFRKIASTPKRLFFRKDYNYRGKVRRIHIHLVKVGSKDWTEMTFFRDYLLEHPQAVKDYAQIKKEAVKKAKGEGKVYKEFKKEFITSITQKARVKSKE